MHNYDVMRSKIDKYEADHKKLMSLLTETDRGRVSGATVPSPMHIAVPSEMRHAE